MLSGKTHHLFLIGLKQSKLARTNERVDKHCNVTIETNNTKLAWILWVDDVGVRCCHRTYNEFAVVVELLLILLEDCRRMLVAIPRLVVSVYNDGVILLIILLSILNRR